MLNKLHEDKLLELAIDLALKAGEEILKIYNTGFTVDYKADNSPLTTADKAAHYIISSGLNATDIHILSEEGKAIPFEVRKKWPKLWIVDPLDGTKEFIRRNDDFTVNIALIHKQVPVLGVVYCPPLRTLYFASEVIGASYRATVPAEKNLPFADLLQISEKLPDETGSEKLRIVASKSHMNNETSGFIDQLKEKYDQVSLVSRGSSLKLCQVAEGSADIYPRFAPTSEWDTAAANAVVNFAGGIVLDANTKEPLKYNKENILNPWFIVTRQLSYLNSVT